MAKRAGPDIFFAVSIGGRDRTTKETFLVNVFLIQEIRGEEEEEQFARDGWHVLKILYCRFRFFFFFSVFFFFLSPFYPSDFNRFRLCVARLPCRAAAAILFPPLFHIVHLPS